MEYEILIVPSEEFEQEMTSLNLTDYQRSKLMEFARNKMLEHEEVAAKNFDKALAKAPSDRENEQKESVKSDQGPIYEANGWVSKD